MITIVRNYMYPVRIEIAEDNLCTSIRNIYFSGVNAYSARMPMIKGRADCHVENIHFTDCHFTQIPYEDIPTKFAAHMAKQNFALTAPKFRMVDNLVFNNTFFTVL